MYDKILVPYDGSKDGKKGAEHAIDLAEALGSEVHALYVIDLPGAPRTVYVRDDEEQMRQEYREYGEDVTGDVCEWAGDRGLECTSAIRTGAPAEEIVDYAEENEMDAIVMGVAYRGTLQGLLGGTSDKVVRSSSVPVVTTRMQMDE